MLCMNHARKAPFMAKIDCFAYNHALIYKSKSPFMPIINLPYKKYIFFKPVTPSL